MAESSAPRLREYARPSCICVASVGDWPVWLWKLLNLVDDDASAWIQEQIVGPVPFYAQLWTDPMPDRDEATGASVERHETTRAALERWCAHQKRKEEAKPRQPTWRPTRRARREAPRPRRPPKKQDTLF